MDTLNRLVIKARRTAQARPEYFHFGAVKKYKDEDPYISQAFVWTGEPGSGQEIVSTHETEQEAVDALYAVYNQYPNTKEDALIFVGGYDVFD